jgi:OOP family OmpA-OmpF porin
VEKIMKQIKSVCAWSLVGLVGVSGPAVGVEPGDWYVGIGAGRSQVNIADERIRSQLLGAGLTMTSIDDDDRDLGYTLAGGRKFNRNFALEGGYFDLGEFGFTANTTLPGALIGTLELRGVNMDAIGILPLGEKFSAFGRAGVIRAEAKDTFRGTGGVTVVNPNPEERDTNYKVGLGVQYDFTPSLGLVGEWQRYRVNDAVGNTGDVDLALVRLVYAFGATRSAPRAAAVSEAAPAPTQTPAPVLVVVPVAQTQQYCGILDIQFEIDRDAIEREEQEKLSVLETFLKKYPETTAVIEGHTDEVGASAENMRLSQRRAESVVSYLANRGIARSRLEAVGYGETRPLADNRTQIGQRLNRRINAVVACATDIEGLTPSAARMTMAMEMEFDTDAADIRSRDREELRKVANFMRATPLVTATVEGHSSNQQTPAQGMQLSVRRAETVVNALVDLGVERRRLQVAGFGQTRRFAYNTSAEGQQENRRVNIIFDFPN